jgi:hypothetical protein
MMGVIVALVVLALLAAVGAAAAFRRAPEWNAPMPEADRSRMRFESFWRAALCWAALVLIGLALAAVTWKG